MAILTILLLCILSSCSSDIDCYKDEGVVNSKSIIEPFIITNDAKGVTLHIDSCSITKMGPSLVEYGDTIMLESYESGKKMICLFGMLSFGNMIAYKGKMIAPENPATVSNLCDSLGARIFCTVSFDITFQDWYN